MDIEDYLESIAHIAKVMLDSLTTEVLQDRALLEKVRRIDTDLGDALGIIERIEGKEGTLRP